MVLRLDVQISAKLENVIRQSLPGAVIISRERGSVMVECKSPPGLPCIARQIAENIVGPGKATWMG